MLKINKIQVNKITYIDINIMLIFYVLNIYTPLFFLFYSKVLVNKKNKYT